MSKCFLLAIPVNESVIASRCASFKFLAQSVNFGRRTLEFFLESTTAAEHLVGFLFERSNEVINFIGAAGATDLSEGVLQSGFVCFRAL